MTLIRQQQRRGTAAFWASVNPVLAAGEIGFISDNSPAFKIGDGASPWNDLPQSAISLDDLQVYLDGATTQADAAESAAADAAASASQAAQAAGILEDDDAVAYAAQYGIRTIEAISEAYGPHKHPLYRGLDTLNNYTAKRVFRVLLSSTSIGLFDPSAIQVLLAETIGDLFGHSAYNQLCLGIAGGNFEDPYFGWKHQHYGGNAFTRLVGDATSQTVPLVSDYCDTITVEFSREADSAPGTVLVDGAPVGTSTGPGTSRYGQAVTVTVPLGWHAISIQPPAGAGRCYAETIITADSTRRDGLEVLGYGLGGTGLHNLTEVFPKPPGSQQLDPIAITNNAGLDYYFGRTDVDLYVIQGPVNSRGSQAYMDNLEYGIEQARLNGVPVLLIIEPMSQYPSDGGYQVVREHMLRMGRLPWVTVVDWHAMLWPGQDLHDASLQAKMVQLYFPGGAGDPHPSDQAHMILAAALATVLGVPMPGAGVTSTAIDAYGLALFRRLHPRAVPVVPKGPTRATVYHRTYALPAPEGPVVQVVALGGPSATNKQAAYYRVPLVASSRDFVQSAAIVWLDTPQGTDEFGPYATGVADPGGGQATADNGQLVRFTARVRAVSGATTATPITFRFPGGLRVEDDKGNQRPRTDVGANLTDVSYQLYPGEPPVTLSILARVVNNTLAMSPTLGGSGLRVYDATCLPVATATDPVLLDRASSLVSWLRELPVLDVPASVSVGAKSRHYTAADGGAYDLRSASYATDLVAENTPDGQVVPFYRDQSVPQLAKHSSDGGATFTQDINAFIAGQGTSDPAGTYYSSGGFDLVSVGNLTAGQELTVLARFRGNYTTWRTTTGENLRTVVNGVVRTDDVKWTYGTDDPIRPAFWFTYRVRAIADGPAFLRFSLSRLYELHVTDSTHPIRTV